MNKKEVTLCKKWQFSTDNELWHVYRTPSVNKIKAFEECKKDMMEHNGSYMRITSYNKMQFSCAYLYNTDNGTYMRYFTRDNIYDFNVDDIKITG